MAGRNQAENSFGRGNPITVGAVGKPRHQTDRRAAWALWDPSENIVEFRKTDYNRPQAMQDIADAGLPLESGFQLLTKEEAAVFLKSLRDDSSFGISPALQPPTF